MTALATAAVSILSPYLAKVADGAAERLGELATEKSGSLYRWLKDKLAGQRAEEALDDLRAQPRDGDVQATLRVQLRRALAAEPRLAEELSNLLSEMRQEPLGVRQAQSVSGDGATGIQIAGNSNMVNVR